VLQGADGPTALLVISPDSRWLLWTEQPASEPGAQPARACVWSLDAAEPARACASLRGHDGRLLAAAFSHDGRWVVTSGTDGVVRLYDLTTQPPAAEQVVLPGHQGEVTTLSISDNGRRLYTGGADGTARVWELNPEVLFEMARLARPLPRRGDGVTR
jgi:WD40 repeat protein